ncbi:carbohydrate binding domain-containing protein [Cohnella silvisoli]|uniref:Carbohydrate binding domain-containing protein n=1 Tax=Cohnella silvisoli TaxID=2873699 RepID=A0ABV1KRL1_9BACL|nr:carbohydrate binding domain-containing protein [Cohnella silvisoli]MCD9022440.1 carbohydrate binding domain-containing protein [Cohnella silvisoli]
MMRDWKRKSSLKWGVLLSMCLVLATGGGTAFASGTGEFHIGGFQQPIAKNVDYNTNANWANVANAYIDRMMSVELGYGYPNKAENETGIVNSNANNVQLYVTDGSLYGFQSYTAADYATLESNLTPYKLDSRVKAINYKDEPAAWNIEGFANTLRHARAFAPQLDYFINLLPSFDEYNTYATSGKLALSNSGARQDGTYVTSTQRLGQTIKIPAGMTVLQGVDMMIDMRQWSPNEMLTLRLWTSTAKTTLLSEAYAWGNNSSLERDFYPYFVLNAPVTSGTTYYLELTHNGGGDNTVGWVMRSNSDIYPDGSAYVNGVAQSNDFFFRLYKPRDNTPDVTSPGNTDGDYVSTGTRIGQTFTTPSSVNRRLSYIQMNIDSSQWNIGNQPLTVTLWDNSSRNTKIATSDTYTSSNNGNYPIFKLNQPVKPNTSYYFELTSTSGTPLGWVTKGTSSTYAGGQGYKNGTPLSGGIDYYFKAIFGSNYENYIDDMLDISGHDELLFDNYPFQGGTAFDSTYFQNAELIRERGLAHDVKYGGFLQSTKITDLSGNAFLRAPNLDEKRFNVYTYLTYGFKLMYWFTYWQPISPCCGDVIFSDTPVSTTGTLQPAYYHIQALNKEMYYLGNTLKNLTSQAVYHSGTAIPKGTVPIPASFFVKPADMTQPILEGYFTDASGRKYVMLTNRDYNNARTLDFNFFPKPASLTEISKTTGLEVSTGFSYNASTGVLNIALGKGEGRLFALSNTTTNDNLIANPGFESGTTSWGTAFSGSLTADSIVKSSGTYSGKITSRPYAHSSPTQDLTSALTTGGQGLYNLSGWIKLAAGADRAQIVIQIKDDLGTHWSYTDYTSVNSIGWTQSAKSTNINWTGALQSAILYVQTESTNNYDMYVDDFVLTH